MCVSVCVYISIMNNHLLVVKPIKANTRESMQKMDVIEDYRPSSPKVNNSIWIGHKTHRSKKISKWTPSGPEHCTPNSEWILK